MYMCAYTYIYIYIHSMSIMMIMIVSILIATRITTSQGRHVRPRLGGQELGALLRQLAGARRGDQGEPPV